MLKLSYYTKLTRRQSQWTILKIPQNTQKGKHFSYGDRRELQGILSNKSVRYSLRQLARHFNCDPNTIRNELKRGAHHNTGRYGARRAQNAYEQSHANSIRKSRRFLSSKFVS